MDDGRVETVTDGVETAAVVRVAYHFPVIASCTGILACSNQQQPRLTRVYRTRRRGWE